MDCSALPNLRRPELAATLPLKPNSRTSILTVPVAVELAVIRTTLDGAAPRSFTGKRENPISGPFGKTDISWNIARNTLVLAGKPDGLALSTNVSGTLRVTASSSGDAVTGSLNPDVERGMQEFIQGKLDERGEVRGNVRLTAKPALLPNWRIDPNLSGHMTIPEDGLTVAGIMIDVTGDVKSAIDRTVNEQLNVVETQVRNDSTIEQVARREWARMCRSISLAAIAAGNPDFFLELRPIRAFAAHPLIAANAATVTLGVEAETRIIASASKPDCPFPAQLEIVPPVDTGRFSIAVPIEVPFTEVTRNLNRQLRGRTFPEGADAPAQVTVRRAHVWPSGDQLLISLMVYAQEQKTWFGFDARATIFIWVRPQLDRAEQKLRLTDIVVDVRSRAGFGLFSAVARAAIPYIQEELEKYAVIDLKPYAASARTGIEAVVAEFDKQDDGVGAGATVTNLDLVIVEFDSKTLRVIAEAAGTMKIAVTKLPPQK